MSSNKYGSMFDDEDEDLGGTPQVSPEEVEETKPVEIGLLNDEAKALIEAKAKQAADQGKRAARAGLAAVGRAGVAIKVQGEKLKSRVQGGSKQIKRPVVLGVLGAIVVAGGVAGWWVWSKDETLRELPKVEAPVVDTPTATAAPEPEADPLPPSPAAVEVEQSTTVEQPEPMPTMPTIDPAVVRDVPPRPVEATAPSVLSKPVATRDAPAPVVATPAPKPAPVEVRPSVAEKTKPAGNARRSRPQQPVPKQADRAPAPIGEREQQQIDQIHALFGDGKQ